ncbi:MAG: hypothetical protein SPI30_02240 [Prevotella sp.]|nr:hypothetical protein [Prevotella sp.]
MTGWNLQKHRFHPHEVFWENGKVRTRHRTGHWYDDYQALVRSVPFVGTACTNEWYQFNPNRS